MIEPVMMPSSHQSAQGGRIEKEEDEGERVNVPAFGYYRGACERAIYLEFQRLKDSWLAAGYAWLSCPVLLHAGDSKGKGQAIILEYVSGLKVTIRGRNLRPCYERILNRQAFRISEMGEGIEQFFPEDATVVYAIEVVETRNLACNA